MEKSRPPCVGELNHSAQPCSTSPGPLSLQEWEQGIAFPSPVSFPNCLSQLRFPHQAFRLSLFPRSRILGFTAPPAWEGGAPMTQMM